MAELGMAFLNPFAAQQQMDVVDAKLGPEVANLQAMARLHNANAGAQEADLAGKQAAQAFWQKRLGAIGQDPNFRGPMPQEGAALDPSTFFDDAAKFELSQGNTGEAGTLLGQGARH